MHFPSMVRLIEFPITQEIRCLFELYPSVRLMIAPESSDVRAFLKIAVKGQAEFLSVEFFHLLVGSHLSQ